MQYPLLLAEHSDARLQLQHAAWVSGGDNLRLGPFDQFHFVPQDLHRHLVLNHVIDPGAATADIRLRNFAIFHARNRLQQLARRILDPLPVRQMAGILVRHNRFQATHLIVQFQRSQELRHILHFFYKALGRLGVIVIGSQQLVVLL